MARPRKGVTFWDRVWNHVERQGDCLVFNGHRDACGYGRISRDGKLVRIHREVWKHHNPGVEITGVIMHSCDNPACVNIDHLSHGTQVENIEDMRSKGRGRYLAGSQQSQAKLTEDDVRVIKERLILGVTAARLARDFNVSEAAIQNIKHRRRWTHV